MKLAGANNGTSKIQFHRTTKLTPEQYVAGLTDFGSGRSKLLAAVPTSTSRCIAAALATQT